MIMFLSCFVNKFGKLILLFSIVNENSSFFAASCLVMSVQKTNEVFHSEFTVG